MGNEAAIGLDLVVQVAQLVAVFGDTEVGDDPAEFAKEVDDGADIEELLFDLFVA